jgi:predicted dehydrogenase
MSDQPLRIGIVGLGGNTRARHVPGLLACPNVQITAVCNRRPESTAAAAREFGIAKTYDKWQDLVHDPDVDAIVIGTWPYLHHPITIAAIEQGKHVLCEARMAMNATEAREMLAASEARPNVVCQLVPSPYGLRIHKQVKQLLAAGYLGELREVVAISTNDGLADPAAPLAWRQVAELSGVNMLTLGIVHEALIRWIGDPVRVRAQAHACTPERLDPATGVRRRVGTPDSVQVLATFAGGAQGMYHVSGVTRFGPGTQVHLYGSEGTLKLELMPTERIWGARRGEAALSELPLIDDPHGGWRVESDFVASIREGRPVEFTDFESGVRYMEFTEAVARSALTGAAVMLEDV